MPGFGSQIRKRLKQLEKAGADVPRVINECAKTATIAAVEKAVEKTPPNGTGLAGVNVRAGVLAGSWPNDSVITPTRGRTILANNQEYASYVNDGHRMDRHFVPGLHVEGDHLSYDADFDGGLVVGTRTAYVPGKFMKEAAIGTYRTVLRKELSRKVRETIERQNV